MRMILPPVHLEFGFQMWHLVSEQVKKLTNGDKLPVNDRPFQMEVPADLIQIFSVAIERRSDLLFGIGLTRDCTRSRMASPPTET